VSRSHAPINPSEPSARELLAINLIRWRKEKGLSQEALAFEAGLHRTFVAHVERQVRNISLDNLERLALALELKPYQLLQPSAKVQI
jgi:transcriptional regulator with XRE-family HTH domain